MLPKILFSLIIFLVIISSLAIFYSGYDKILVPNSYLVNPSPTPVPFEEMTIPYLRNRGYQSSLGLLEKYGENSNYTSFLTNYDSDGLKINGLLAIPKGEPPVGGWPAIVFIHGYIPPSQYKTTQNYISYVDFLAKNELVVFKIDLRGHDQSEGEPGGAYYSADYVIDTLNAYAALQSADFVNRDAIGLWGHSMAGNVVFRSMAAKPDIPAVVIWAGAIYSYEDFTKYRLSDNSYRPPQTSVSRQRRRQELFDRYGEFNKDNSFWKKVAATNYVGDLAGAIQLHHAIDDAVVNIGYSRDLTTLLDQTSIIHEMHEYSTGGHNIIGASFTQAMKETIEFFNKYLK